MAHADDCYLDPAHHMCAVVRAARAEGGLGEARAVATDALAALQQAAADRAMLGRIRSLLEEQERDLDLHGEEWHPRARAMASQIITQMRAALGGGGP